MDISSYYYYLIWHLRAKIMTQRNIARLALVTLVLALRAPAAGAADPVYFSADQIDAVALLEPPPAAGSDADRRDLDAVIARQHAAHSDGTLARGVGDAALNCGRVADVFIPGGHPGDTPLPRELTSGEGEAALAFASRAALQAALATGPAKRYWHRPRPYMASPEVERRGDVAPDYPMPADLARERDISAYPSGHTAFGTACAIVLSQMVPEQRVALFARARLYGESRIIIGAHYPSDVEAGRLIGTAAAAVMLRNAQFQEDLQRARPGLRRALGLSAVSP
jgi:acid phosphatase (class A)